MNVSCCCGRGRNTNVILMCLAAEGLRVGNGIGVAASRLRR